MTNAELAILGLLAEAPKYGYQIEQNIEQRGMRDWTEIAFSSIYYLLNKLEGSGWLSSVQQVEKDRPARKVYQLTGPGWEVYRQAVRERLAAPHPRSGDFELGLANLPALDPQEGRDAIRACRDQLAGQVARIQGKREDQGGEQLPEPARAVFSHGLALMQAELNWIDAWLEEKKESSRKKDEQSAGK